MADIVDVNATGGGAATVRVSGTTVSAKNNGFLQHGAGVLQSLGNNVVRGNTSDKLGTISIIAGD